MAVNLTANTTRCAYRIFKNNGAYGIAINVADDTTAAWSDASNYNLYVNGSAYINTNLTVASQLAVTRKASFASDVAISSALSATSLTLTNPLSINYGGTGATTAANALTNIGAASAGHNHALTDLTGTLTIAKGGTGKTTATEAWTALGGGASGKHADSYFALAAHEHGAGDITSGTLPIARGGTNATTAANARTQLGITPANIGAKATQTAVSDPAYDGDSITFIDTISQNAQGVITPHKAAVRSASTTQNGIVTIGAQSFAGNKTFTGWVAASGNVYVRENNSSIAGGMNCLYAGTTNTWDHRITFYQYSYNADGTRTDKYDRFYFPTTASASNASPTYLIITTKNPSSLTITDLSGTLTVAKGGTGATTAANARTQLGLGSAATHDHSDYVTIADTQTITGAKSYTNHIDMKGGYYYRWYKSTGTTICAFIAAYGSTTDTVPPQIAFYEYGYNTSTGARLASYERFILPAPSSTLTTHAYHSILTTKSAVTIAQGGTGQSALESSALTYATNSHITSAQMSANMKVFKFGKVGMLVSTGASLAAYSYSGWVKIGSVPAAYKPAMNATNRIPVSSTNWRIQIDTDGNVNVYKSTSDTTLFYCSFAYPLA